MFQATVKRRLQRRCKNLKSTSWCGCIEELSHMVSSDGPNDKLRDIDTLLEVSACVAAVVEGHRIEQIVIGNSARDEEDSGGH